MDEWQQREAETERRERDLQDAAVRKLAEQRRQKVLHKMHEIELRRNTENLKLKQRCFSAWFDVVLARRLQFGKAKAMSDWKQTVRAFNAWKAFAREKRLVREAWAHEEELKLVSRSVVRRKYARYL